MPAAQQISLDQWHALVAVVEAGGYAQAADRLFKSQSSVTYAVQKIEAQLGVKVFEIRGRKAVLTSTGQMLYRRARALVNEAAELERAAPDKIRTAAVVDGLPEMAAWILGSVKRAA